MNVSAQTKVVQRTVGSLVTYMCPVAYSDDTRKLAVVTIECLDNLTWSGLPAVCTSKHRTSACFYVVLVWRHL